MYVHSPNCRWKEQEAFVEQLLSKLETSGAGEMSKLRESENKLQLRIQESTRRENVLNMRLATKQQEMHELAVSFIQALPHFTLNYYFVSRTYIYIHTPPTVL